MRKHINKIKTFSVGKLAPNEGGCDRNGVQRNREQMWTPNSNISLTASSRRGLSTPIRKLVWLEETAQGLGILAALSGD